MERIDWSWFMLMVILGFITIGLAIHPDVPWYVFWITWAIAWWIFIYKLVMPEPNDDDKEMGLNFLTKKQHDERFPDELEIL